MTTNQIKTAKRIVAAEGYLELGLPDRALDELFSCDPSESNFQAAAQSLAAEARSQIDVGLGVAVAVAEPIERSEQAELQLAECYRRIGFGSQSANIVASNTRGAK
ncbi:MAG: hypothetical protein MPJ50_09685 [Pirellulales bacterium]|nr:hypothetical protein [Pirellulales bacterium]